MSIKLSDSVGMARLQRAYDAQTPWDNDPEPCPCGQCRNWRNGVCRIVTEDEDGNEVVEEWQTDRYDTCENVDPKESEY